MDDARRNDETLAQVLERLEAVERENRALREETARLTHTLSDADRHTNRGPDDGRVSRRTMLRLGAVAAAGTAAAAGSLVAAQPAAAGTDGDLTLGSATNSAGTPTGLEVNGDTSAYGIGVTDNGLNAYPDGQPHAALFGHAVGTNFQAGVFGFSDNGQTAVQAVSYANSVTGAPGPGVYALGVPAVHGFATEVGGTGVQGTNAGFVTIPGGAMHPATGIGVLAETIDNEGGPPTAASIALSASNGGKGIGVKATSVSGTPIVASITKTANTHPCVQATTSGTGAAISGTGAANGRGGQFTGGAAQIRLVPGGTLPTSGQTGDLFVDSGGHLHYCRAGGSTATWVQLA